MFNDTTRNLIAALAALPMTLIIGAASVATFSYIV